jgi:hypothetical protein
VTQPRTVLQADGRVKAYRPLPEADRAAAVHAGLEAYDRGDYFLAHELMEPAWMGTADPAERALVQGLIKLAAAEVHGVRGNPRGVRRNREGSLDRLRIAAAAGTEAPDGLDLAILIETVEASLARADAGAIDLPRRRT